MRELFRGSLSPFGWILLAAAAFALWRPARGLQDRLAGTFLVPR
jgi:hypothetical protein